MPRERDQAWRELGDALETLGRQVGSAVGAMGGALLAPEVREQALRASRAFADAVQASVPGFAADSGRGRKRASKRHDR